MEGVTPDWYFEVVSAVQRFICETADAPFPQVITCAGAFAAAIPRAPSPYARAVLRSMLFELAIQWGFRRHTRLRSRCREATCVPAAFSTAARYWSDGTRLPREVFLSWLREYCAEVDATHPDPLAERAVSWMRATVTSRFDVRQMARDLASNPTAIRRAVHDRFQTTPRGLHERIRVEYVQALLAAPSTKMASLAREAGWKSKKNMYRAVRNVRGCTPGALKRRNSA